MMYDPNKQVWLNPNIEYLFDQDIIEYDMRDAGFSLIKQYKLLPEEIIRRLSGIEKHQRHIEVGKIQGKDKEFSKALSNKFAEIRKLFIESNKLTDDEIISVKKDAIFTIGFCSKTKFGGILFNQKNHYSSYIRFPNVRDLEIYYSSDNIDIKGMSDSTVNRHRLYMLEFIRKIIDMIESNNSSVKRYIINFIGEYKNRELDETFYLEFNNKSKDINPLFNYQNIIIPLIQIINKEIN